MHQINLDQINIDVVLKNIKNMYLAILPPLGKVYHFNFKINKSNNVF